MADKTTPAAAAEPRSAAKGAKPAKSPKPTKSSKAASAKPKPAGATVDWNRARGLVGQAMERDGLSLRGFASAVGIDHGNLSRFLAAGATGALATETAVALAEHLQLPLDGFLGLAPDGPTAARFLRVPLDEIAAGANPRRHFDEAKLAELADSIAEEGLRTPLWAVATEPGGEQGGQPTLYRLIAGERRLRALRILAADKTRKAAFQRVLPGALVPVQLYPADPLGEAVAAIVENVQREDLAQWELTAALVRLRDDHGLDGAAISRRLGLNERQVQQHLAINDKLSAELRVLYDAGDLSFTAARFAITDRRDVDLSPEAPAQAEADAEVAAPVLKSLFRGRIWHVEAVYRRYAPGAARGEFGVEFAIFQGDEEIDRAEARDDAVLAATALVLNQLTVGPLDAAIRGFLDLGDDPAEAEDLAGLCRTLGRLYIGQDPGVSGFFLKSVGALANWGAEPAAAPEAERRVLFEDAG
ncbi:MAG: ParB N-terminal domain-containing protein, partial [Tistlia sp.]